MMKLLLAAGAGLALATSASAQTTGGMKAMPGMAAPKASSGSTMVMAEGVGVVRAVDPTAGTVTLEHGPIAALNWPAMVMKLKANPATLLKGLRVGQPVKFQLMQMGETTEVRGIRPN